MPSANIPNSVTSESVSPKIHYRDPSVRTSFSLSPEAMEAMDWLMEKIGPPKEVFEGALASGLLDLTLDDMLRASGKAESGSDVHMPDMPLPENSIRKSFVIGNRTLQALKTQARRRKIKRDVLVTHLILSHKKATEEDHKRLFEKQNEAQKLLRGFWDLGSEVEGKIRELLGEDDPIFRAFSAEFGWLEDQVLNAIEGLLKDGAPITEPLSRTYR